MDAERWSLVQTLFEASVDLPPAERETLLNERCGDDQSLIDEVLSLIGADEEKHSLLDGAAAELLGIVTEDTLVGRRVGSYKLVKKIASGGMGAVFLAERSDGHYSQQVALKLIKPGMSSDEVMRRFRSERQILAGLNHPNIAGLIDGGLTDEGLPWLAMEYVPGEPIDFYCDRRKLTVDERLKLFLTVCRAVEYAQQNLVVHRDLKPSNIMVTDDGTVKLLDFGIAKILDTGDTSEYQPDLTRTGYRVMTPGYASPEQVRGDRVTTASDVYSLGVVLYRLLTGHSPHHKSGRTPQELEKAVFETSPEKPSRLAPLSGAREGTEASSGHPLGEVCASRRTHPAQLRRRLSGDLDNICLTALRKERERRYQSAAQLAEDVQRHLEGRPVSARSDSVGYRAGKFLARHKLEVAATALVLLVTGTLISFYTVRLAAERDRAALEAAKASEVADFLTELFTVADPNESKGASVTARELLDRGAGQIRNELSDQPETQGAMLSTVGVVYQQLGLLAKADTLLTEAMNLRLNTLGHDNLETARSIHNLAVLADDREQLVRAERLYREALDINVRLSGEDNIETAATMNNLAAILRAQGNIEEARGLFEKAYETRLRLLGEEDAETAHSMNHLGGVLHDLGQDEGAEKMLRRGLEIRLELYDSVHFEVAASQGKLARFLRDRGEYKESKRYYREGLATLHKLVGENHYYVGAMTTALAYVLHLNGEYDAADSLYHDGLAILRRTLPPGHIALSNPLLGLGRLELDRGRLDEAEKNLREALALRKAGLPAGHWKIAEAQGLLGICLADLGRADEALPLLESSEQVMNRERLLEDRFSSRVGEYLSRLKVKQGS